MARAGRGGPPAEGLFFPDTYLYGKGTRDIECCARPAIACARNWPRPGPRASADLPLQDEYEALILASIVERETAHRGRTGAHRRRIRRAPAPRHAPADRSHGDLRPRRQIRRQPASCGPRARHALQYVHARRTAADADRAARAPDRCGRRSSPTSAASCSSSRRASATGRTCFRRRSASTRPPCGSTSCVTGSRTARVVE